MPESECRGRICLERLRQIGRPFEGGREFGGDPVAITLRETRVLEHERHEVRADGERLGESRGGNGKDDGSGKNEAREFHGDITHQ